MVWQYAIMRELSGWHTDLALGWQQRQRWQQEELQFAGSFWTISCFWRQEDRGEGRTSSDKGCTCCGNKKHGTLSMYLALSMRGGTTSTWARMWCLGAWGGGRESQGKRGGWEGESQDCSNNQTGITRLKNKASPARLMGVKQNKKQSHRLHHPQSGRLHVAAMSLTGDEGSSGPMSFLGK
jgi:hypothetical protein